jgi:fatty acid desaturase
LKNANKGFIFQEKFHSKAEFDRTLSPNDSSLGLPDVPDFRLCCRTYTCSPFIGFLYWNMQYHVEHHMFPAVQFYNLPALRKAIEHDLPPAQHGLWATWREIIPVLKKQRENPDYVFVPELPKAA